MPVEKVLRNIPLSMDRQLLASVDRVATELKETRSAVMRQAIAAGLPVVRRKCVAGFALLGVLLSAMNHRKVNGKKGGAK